VRISASVVASVSTITCSKLTKSPSRLNFGSSLVHLHWWCNQWSILSWYSYHFVCRGYPFLFPQTQIILIRYQYSTHWVNCNHISQSFQMQVYADLMQAEEDRYK